MNQENYKEEFSKEDYMAMREAAKNIVNEIHQDYNGSEKDKLDLAQQAIYDKRLNIRQLKAEDKLHLLLTTDRGKWSKLEQAAFPVAMQLEGYEA